MAKKNEQGEIRRMNRLFISASKRFSEGESVNEVLDDLRERHELTEEECEALLDRSEDETAEDLSS